jgi:hypothetical protein
MALLLLLVSAGLFIRSLQRAASIDPGFNVRNVDTLQIDTHLGGYRRSRGFRWSPARTRPKCT